MFAQEASIITLDCWLGTMIECPPRVKASTLAYAWLGVHGSWVFAIIN